MKTIYLSIAMLFLSVMSLAQSSLNIYGLPNLNKGYAVWNCDDPDLSYYRVHILENTLSGNTLNQTLLERHELWGINYLKVKDDFWKTSHSDKWYTIQVLAFNSSGNQISVDEEDLQDVINSAGPEGGFGETLCNWECVSSNYAYRIQAYDYNGFNYIQMNTFDYVNEAGIGVPHYRWFDPVEYDMYTDEGFGSGSSNYHGMSSGWNFPEVGEPYVEGAQIIKLENTSDSYFCDVNGTQITSNYVYGIQKALGPWEDGNEYRMYDYGVNLCLVQYGMAPPDGLGALINLMNNENDDPNLPTLACAANLGAGCGSNGNGTPDDGIFDDIEIEAEVECGIIFTYNSIWGPIGDAIDSDFDCLPPSNLIIDGEIAIGTFLASTEVFQIVELDESPETILLTSASDYIDASGEPISMSLNLEPGLYKIIAKTPNKGLRYTIAEVDNRINLSLLHKDYFSAVIFPNPIINNNYNIQMQASARLNVLYELFDSQGNLLWKQSFNLKDGHDESHQIDPGLQIPSGMLLHKFSFEDGSSETYTTLRN